MRGLVIYSLLGYLINWIVLFSCGLSVILPVISMTLGHLITYNVASSGRLEIFWPSTPFRTDKEGLVSRVVLQVLDYGLMA